jgi:protein-tyrosine kinase
MERIQAAIQKAKEQRGAIDAPVPGGVGSAAPARGAPRAAPVGPAWNELAVFEPEARLVARNHIVTFEDIDPAHSHFDILRTKVLRAMRRGGWTSLGITSPTSGCGKTTLALALGLKAPQSMASVLQGTRGIAESFVRYGDSLAIGTNAQSVRNSAELLMNPRTADGIAAIKRAFLPDVIIYDLPPMLQSDDVMAFLPHLDCVLLVAGAEKSRLDEVDKCEKDIAEQTNVLGVALNLCRYMAEDFGY